MIALRRHFDVFRIGDMAKINASAKLLASNDDNRLTLGYSINWTDGNWYVLVNGEKTAMAFDLGTDASGATVFADANGANVKGIASPAGLAISKNTVTVDPLTSVIIRLPK
jgi:hypothetical protein